MSKPIGPICNIGCEYCFYLSREQLFPRGEPFRMTDATVWEHIRSVIGASRGPKVDFAWQGGEPTLMGLDFFRQAVAIQRELLPAGWTATNGLQTNGTLLTDAWCEFFKAEHFLVGLSMDGPAHLHDRYRVDKHGEPTYAQVLRGLRLMQAHGVEHNILCVVNSANAAHPLEVYRFFQELGVTWLQFIPLVERLGEGAAVSDRSVGAAAFGSFLSTIFDEWVRADVGQRFVQIFEECLSVWVGRGASLCIFQETCGRALVLEHNGDLYACDHFVEPRYNLGNVHFVSLAEILESPDLKQFGLDKRTTLPRYCRECSVRFMCNGACPKDRFIFTPDGESGLNYLCAGYKQFFTHVDPYMRRMAELYRKRISPATVMAEVRQADKARWQGVGRNDLCPCGTGKKYKACCLPRRQG